MNLAYHYNILYWNTACLVVNAGADETNEDNKNTDYGKVAKAIGEMQNRGIKIDLPHINKAEFGFYPDIPNNTIVFGLKGINGLGDEVVTEIVKNKPYKSFKDFMDRMVLIENAPVKQGQVVILIKSGAFDLLENKPREEILKNYIEMTIEKKTQIDFKNLPTLVKYKVIPNEYSIYERYFKFRKYIFSKKFFYKQDEKVKGKQHYELDSISEQFFNEHFISGLQEGKDYYWNENGKVVVINKNFDSFYNKKMNCLREILPKLLEPLNKALVNESYIEVSQGNISSWEMESLSFYYHEHELINVDRDKYSISNFFELSEEPIVAETKKTKKGEFKQFKLSRIVGTVLGRDKTRHVVTLLTTDGVVNVKYYSGQFTNYDKQLSEPIEGTDKKRVVEKGWFTKGTKLMLTGFRRGDQFIPRTYKNDIFLGHSTMKIININHEGELELQLERKRIGD